MERGVGGRGRELAPEVSRGIEGAPGRGGVALGREPVPLDSSGDSPVCDAREIDRPADFTRGSWSLIIKLDLSSWMMGFEVERGWLGRPWLAGFRCRCRRERVWIALDNYANFCFVFEISLLGKMELAMETYLTLKLL